MALRSVFLEAYAHSNCAPAQHISRDPVKQGVPVRVLRPSCLDPTSLDLLHDFGCCTANYEHIARVYIVRKPQEHLSRSQATVGFCGHGG